MLSAKDRTWLWAGPDRRMLLQQDYLSTRRAINRYMQFLRGDTTSLWAKGHDNDREKLGRVFGGTAVCKSNLRALQLTCSYGLVYTRAGGFSAA